MFDLWVYFWFRKEVCEEVVFEVCVGERHERRDQALGESFELLVVGRAQETQK